MKPVNRFEWFSSFDISVLHFGQFRNGNSFMCPLILVLNHVGGQSFNILSVIISNNVCVIIPTNTLKKILSKSTTLYFLFIFRREKIKQIRKTSLIRVFLLLIFLNGAQRKMYTVWINSGKENTQNLPMFILKNYNSFQECPIDMFSRFTIFSFDFVVAVYGFRIEN